MSSYGEGLGIGSWRTACSPSIGPRPSSTSLPRRTSTAPSTVRGPLYRPTWSRHRNSSRPCSPTGASYKVKTTTPSAFCTSPRTRCTGRWGLWLLYRGEPFQAQLPLRRLQGLLRPSRAGLPPHLRAPHAHDQLLQQLRALPLPREAHTAHDTVRPAGGTPARLRRWAAGQGLALRKGPRKGYSHGAPRRPFRRDL